MTRRKPAAVVDPVAAGEVGAFLGSRIVRTGESAPAALLAHPGNWRTHPPRQEAILRETIAAVGWVVPVIVNETSGHILDGHLRVALASKDGIASVPVVWVRVTLDEERTILATLDPISALAVPDALKLAELVADAAANTPALADFFASLRTSSQLAIDLARKREQVEIVAPPLRETTIARGDLFALGAHRLLCGDSTDPDDVARVLAGDVLDAIFTSPPYNQNLKQFAGRVTGIHKDDPWFNRLDEFYADAMPEDAYQAWQVAMLSLWFTVARSGAACFYNHKLRYRERRPIIPLKWLERTPWDLRQELIWDRGGGVAANAEMFIPGDERIYWLEKTGGPYCWRGVGQNKTTVWSIQPAHSPDHICPFPIELVTTAIVPVTQDNDFVGEPYSGSGTTIIACEQTRRQCRAVELMPAYVQVAIDRWETLTGQRAEQIGAAS